MIDRPTALIESMPWPVARPCSVVWDENQPPLRRLEHIFFAYSQYLRVVGLSLLAQYFAEPVVIPALRQCIRMLRQPHIRDWITVINTAKKHLPANGVELCFPTLRADLAAMPFVEGLLPFREKLASPQHPLELLRDVRNRLWGHASPLPDQILMELVSFYAEVIEQVFVRSCFIQDADLMQRLLETMSLPGPDIDGSLVRTEDPLTQVVRLRGSSAPHIVESVVLREPFAANPKAASLFIRTTRGDWPLYPLLIAMEAKGFTQAEPALVFDGHDHRRIVYLGVASQAEVEDGLALYEGILASKNVDLRLTASEVTPWKLATFASFWTRERLSDLLGVKYFPQLYIERPNVDGLVDRFLSQPAFSALLIVGGPGTGKTNLMCHTATRLLQDDQRNVVVLMHGHLFRASELGPFDPFQILRQALGLAKDIASPLHWIELLAAAKPSDDDGRVVLLFDAINESEAPRLLMSWIDELASLSRRFSWIRIVVTVREESFRLLTRKERELGLVQPCIRHDQCYFPNGDRLEWPLPAFSEGESEAAYEQYAADRSSPFARSVCPWGHLAPPLRALLNHPLHLYVYFRIPDVGLDSRQDVDEQVLFHALADEILRSVRDRSTLTSLIDHCLSSGQPIVSHAKVDEIRRNWLSLHGSNPAALAAYLDPLESLVDVGLLVKHADQKGIQFRFTHQSVLEHLIVERLEGIDPQIGPATLSKLVFDVAETLPEGIAAAGSALSRWIDIGQVEWFKELSPVPSEALVQAFVTAVSKSRLPGETLAERLCILSALPTWTGPVLEAARALYRARRLVPSLMIARQVSVSSPSVLERGEAHELIGTILYFLDDIDGSIAALEAAEAAFAEVGFLQAETRCLMRRSYTYYYRRDHERAKVTFTKARSILEANSWHRDLAFLLKNAGTIQDGLAALPLVEAAIELFENLGDSASASVARVNLGVEQFIAGDPISSARTSERALDEMRSLHIVQRISAPLNNLAVARLALGNPSDAKALFLLAQRTCIDGWERAAVLNNLAACCAQLGDAAAAAAHLEGVLEYLEKTADPSIKPRLSLTKLGTSQDLSVSMRKELLIEACRGFLAAQDLRGIAVCLGFIERRYAGDFYGYRRRLLNAIIEQGNPDLTFLKGLVFYPWHIVLFE